MTVQPWSQCNHTSHEETAHDWEDTAHKEENEASFAQRASKNRHRFQKARVVTSFSKNFESTTWRTRASTTEQRVLFTFEMCLPQTKQKPRTCANCLHVSALKQVHQIWHSAHSGNWETTATRNCCLTSSLQYSFSLQVSTREQHVEKKKNLHQHVS